MNNYEYILFVTFSITIFLSLPHFSHNQLSTNSCTAKWQAFQFWSVFVDLPVTFPDFSRLKFREGENMHGSDNRKYSVTILTCVDLGDG
jgi:hypothetical protein